MEIETLFTDQKWNILRFLSEQEYSPLELASSTQTSRANISQQLRLLEAMNLVKKKKISNRDKGKPRTLYSLTQDFAYLIVVSNNFADKKLLQMTPHTGAIMKIWFLENQESHYYFERAYWKVEPFLEKLDAVAVDDSDSLSMILVGKGAKEAADKLSPLVIKRKKGEEKILKLKAVSNNEFEKAVAGGSTVLYNPEFTFTKSPERGDA